MGRVTKMATLLTGTGWPLFATPVDAHGSGTLAGKILGCREAALNRTAKEYSRCGSSTHEQVCRCAGMDTRPTTFACTFGMVWGMGGGWQTPFLQQIGPDAVQQL